MPKTTKMILILENIRSTYNVGNIFRTAEVFGVDEIILCGYTPAPIHKRDQRLPHIAKKINDQISKTALGAERMVDFSVFNNISQALAFAKQKGFLIASLEQSSNSVKIHQYDNIAPRIALVLGNEVDGISQWTKEASDVILEIEQYGKKESLNVANATAIALYALKTAK